MAIRYGFRHIGDDDHEDVDVEEFLRLLSEEFLEHGDLESAMERLLREGYTTRDGERIEGLESLLEKTREKKRALERDLDPEGELLRYHQLLDDIEDLEAAAAQELLDDAVASTDERRIEVTRALVDERAVQRELVGDQLNERIAGYQQYEFISSEAREAFEHLVEQLRQDLLATYFEKSKELAQNPSSEAVSYTHLTLPTKRIV